MNPSIFAEFVAAYFAQFSAGMSARLRGSEQLPPRYFFLRMLREDMSVTGKWEALSGGNGRIAADVVALDSQLPLKARPSITRASGDITKLGLKLAMNENQLTALDALVAQRTIRAMAGGDTARLDNDIARKLFDDTRIAHLAVYERLEWMFLEGLSTGVTLVEDTETAGVGVRLDFGYLASNKFDSATAWNAGSPTPITDIETVLDAANGAGRPVRRMMMDRVTFNRLAKSDEAKAIFAAFAGVPVAGGNSIAIASLARMNEAMEDRFGVTIELVDTSITHQRNGVNTAVKPWAPGAVVFLPSEQVGSLTYARLAEENHPVQNVEYTSPEPWLLLSKYRATDPLSEVTASQSRSVPVIEGVDGIFHLDTLKNLG